jgi:predicted anti-sigma-YlaC factor YlaD
LKVGGTSVVPRDVVCQDFVELVTEYLERALAPPLQAACEAHLDACTPCRIYLEQTRQTIELLGRCLDESVKAAPRPRLLQHFRLLMARRTARRCWW